MSVQIPTAVTLAWSIPAALWLIFWILERSYSFALPLDAMTQMTDAIFMVRHANGTVATDVSQTLKGAYAEMFKPERYVNDRVHIYVSAVVGLLVLWNLWWGDQVRIIKAQQGKNHPYVRLHYNVGWLAMYGMIINQLSLGYVLFIQRMLPFGPLIEVTNMITWMGMTILAPLGVYHAQHGHYEKHRRCMIWVASCLFMNPTHRFFWMLGSKWYTTSSIGGVPGYFGYVSTHSQAIAMVLNFGTAALYSFFVEHKGQTTTGTTPSKIKNK